MTTGTLPAPARGWRVWLLAGVALAMGVTAVLIAPIRQDPAYHDFADRRAILGVPHGLNVLSNLGFVVAGAWSLGRVRRARLPGWERAAGDLFALGLILTGLGSAWYHLEPTSATLVWDRLPLSVLFPTVLAVVVGDRVSASGGRALLVPLAVGALASVGWWHLTDDLRPYALAQFVPMLLIPLMLALFPGRRPAGPLVAGVAVYAVAKVAELADRVVLAVGGVLSGHTLKHLLAAVAAALITRWLAGPRGAGPTAPPRAQA